MAYLEAPERQLTCRLDALTPAERARATMLRAILARATIRVVEDAEGMTFYFTSDIAPTTIVEWRHERPNSATLKHESNEDEADLF
jgi:hypothetical protein